MLAEWPPLARLQGKKSYLAGGWLAGAPAKDLEARLLAGDKTLPGVAISACFCFHLQHVQPSAVKAVDALPGACTNLLFSCT